MEYIAVDTVLSTIHSPTRDTPTTTPLSPKSHPRWSVGSSSKKSAINTNTPTSTSTPVDTTFPAADPTEFVPAYVSQVRALDRDKKLKAEDAARETREMLRLKKTKTWMLKMKEEDAVRGVGVGVGVAGAVKGKQPLSPLKVERARPRPTLQNIVTTHNPLITPRPRPTLQNIVTTHNPLITPRPRPILADIVTQCQPDSPYAVQSPMYNSFAGVGYWASVVSQAQAPVYIPIPKVFATPVDPEANAALEKARFSVELCAQRVAQDALLDGAGSSTATLALPKPKDNTPLSEYCAAMIIMDRKLNEFPHLSAFMQSQPAQTISRLQRYTAERAQIHKDYSFKIVQDVASFQSPLELDTLFEKKRDAYRKLREKRADELAPPGQGVELAWTSYLLDWKEEQFKMWEEQLKAEAEEDSDDGLTYAETLRSIRKESREASREVASRAAAALDEEKTLRRRATVEDLDSWAEILKKGLQAEKERQRSSSGTRDGPRRVRRSREGTDDGEGT